MERWVDGRSANWGRHERISSNDRTDDRGRLGAEAGAWSTALDDAALFGGIASKEVALDRRANAGGEVGDNVRKMETLVGGARGDGLGGGRIGRGDGYLLDRIVAEVASEVGTLFMVGSSHGTRTGRSTSD